MNLLFLHSLARVSVEHMLNAIPEGFLIAIFAWALLRILRRQNSGTRFAVWFLALIAVAFLPMLHGVGAWHGFPRVMSRIAAVTAHPALTVTERWADLIFLVWVAGAGIAMLRLGIALWHLDQLRRSCVAVGTELDPLIQKTVAAMNASGPVTVATSDRVRVPAAIGLWKRTIVLPTWALKELAPADLNVILLHEFAHLRRWDDWTNLIQKIVGAVLFFHPAVWWIENRLSIEREMACDDAVLAETANPHGYANCLVSLLEKSLSHRGWSMAQAAVNRAREASLRLAQILDKNRPAATRIWKPAIGMVGAFSLVCLMTLAETPQIVAVDSGVDHSIVASRQAASHLAGVARVASEEPKVIPAALRDVTRQAKSKKLLSGKPAVAPESVNASAPQSAVIARRANLKESQGRVVEVSTSDNAAAAPPVQTLLFIQSTQYGRLGASVWRVQVWRVVVLTPEQNRAVVPVSSKI